MTVGIARKLSRDKPHRDALLKNLACQLFQHGSIVSTHAKCKEASRVAERIITWTKRALTTRNSVSQAELKSQIQSQLFLAGDNRKLMERLFKEIAPRYLERPGGYTRVLRLEPRANDSAPQSILELVDLPVVSESETVNRGNLKMWLLVKSVINDDANHLPHNPLTLQNLHKLAKFKPEAQLHAEITLVKKILFKELSLPYDETLENEKTQELLKQVCSSSLPKKHAKPSSYAMVPRP
ncbi:mrpl8p [Saccharomyces arboricola H-6]|uniref:Mrpl8p n=1 Tax=Saccharomyces arboricola (strain H-6 / AS 2.3317 / CBS 10644) TaxID=1160507 RepID=J8Q0M7_SACAR|nr:mrpl8p [Saccharomyces arboricola H-6]